MTRPTVRIGGEVQGGGGGGGRRRMRPRKALTGRVHSFRAGGQNCCHWRRRKPDGSTAKAASSRLGANLWMFAADSPVWFWTGSR
ncbi:MAG: hypothetical protein IPM55_21395 [Acidobacteria bacterium]|nr:hypothetical protein [Acidobacteriota bacterium]